MDGEGELRQKDEHQYQQKSVATNTAHLRGWRAKSSPSGLIMSQVSVTEGC